MKKTATISLLVAVLLIPAAASAFDHDHGGWNHLLSRHVSWSPDGTASRVDYGGFKADRVLLDRYLGALSGVSPEEFGGWNRDKRLAFLINAYNAFTIDLILSRYPDLESIKETGSFLSSPWKKKFFTLFGEKTHLDGIEHDMIRREGAYDEPRIHFAVVCASIGCPALRNEAFTHEKLEAQLADGVVRFLSDGSRNRYIPSADTLEISKIFKWYAGDFEKGYGSVEAFLARHADLLARAPEERERVRGGKADVDYLDYDWRLNDTRMK